MATSSNRILTAIIVGFGMILGAGCSIYTKAPEISIHLNLEKRTFVDGEPIPVEVSVINQSGGSLFITKGFTTDVHYLKIRVIDPANRLILPVVREAQTGLAPSPFLGKRFYQGSPVTVVGCDEFTAGAEIVSGTADLRSFFDMSLPGYYSAQLRISATVYNSESCMAFDNEYCALDDYAWRGVLKSEAVYFYLQADSSGAQVTPDQWKLSWLDEDKNVPEIQIQLRSKDDFDVEAINPTSIKINGVSAASVSLLPPKLKAFFNAGKVVEALGDNLQPGKWYRVTITGTLKSGAPFGTEQQIRIVQ